MFVICYDQMQESVAAVSFLIVEEARKRLGVDDTWGYEKVALIVLKNAIFLNKKEFAKFPDSPIH